MVAIGAALPASVPAQTRLPALGEGGDITVAEERQLGDMIVRDIYRDPSYIDDPTLAEYVQGIWDELLAAARKLGVYANGTARVEVVAIDPADYQRNSVEEPRVVTRTRLDRPPLARRDLGGEVKDGPPLGEPAFLQVGSFANLESARSLEAKVVQRVAAPTRVSKANIRGRNLFRVLVGPFADPSELDYARTLLVEAERLTPFVVTDRAP